jgi:hypothetical protein
MPVAGSDPDPICCGTPACPSLKPAAPRRKPKAPYPVTLKPNDRQQKAGFTVARQLPRAPSAQNSLKRLEDRHYRAMNTIPGLPCLVFSAHYRPSPRPITCSWVDSGMASRPRHESRITHHSWLWAQFCFLISAFCFGFGVALGSFAPHFCFVEVGSPVARRPPHRSRRAVFPHRALQPNTLSIARRKVCQFGSVDLTELVACVDFVRWSAPWAISAPTPCHDLLRADPTPRTASAASPCR